MVTPRSPTLNAVCAGRLTEKSARAKAPTKMMTAKRGLPSTAEVTAPASARMPSAQYQSGVFCRNSYSYPSQVIGSIRPSSIAHSSAHILCANLFGAENELTRPAATSGEHPREKMQGAAKPHRWHYQVFLWRNKFKNSRSEYNCSITKCPRP